MKEETGSFSRAETGTAADGSSGAGLARRIYRRSPIRYLRSIAWSHRGLTPADVFVASYPRSWSAWLRFMLTEMLTGESSFVTIRKVASEVGMHLTSPAVVPGGGRLVKTHEPHLARYRRAVHLVRDPRDVCISYFYFLQRIRRIRMKPTDDEGASFDRHLEAFLAGRVDANGTWQSHLLSWLRADDENKCDIVRIRYEDLRADPAVGIVRLGAWLGHEVSVEEARRIADRCSVEAMQQAELAARLADPPVFNRNALRTGQPVVREGRAGVWRTRLTPEQQARFSVFAEGLARMGYEPAATA